MKFPKSISLKNVKESSDIEEIQNEQDNSKSPKLIIPSKPLPVAPGSKRTSNDKNQIPKNKPKSPRISMNSNDDKKVKSPMLSPRTSDEYEDDSGSDEDDIDYNEVDDKSTIKRVIGTDILKGIPPPSRNPPRPPDESDSIPTIRVAGILASALLDEEDRKERIRTWIPKSMDGPSRASHFLGNRNTIFTTKEDLSMLLLFIFINI